MNLLPRCQGPGHCDVRVRLVASRIRQTADARLLLRRICRSSRRTWLNPG